MSLEKTLTLEELESRIASTQNQIIHSLNELESKTVSVPAKAEIPVLRELLGTLWALNALVMRAAKERI
ncbi:MAG: hypothetical protein ACREDR_37810 [Blastocatellia bacterium]